MKTISTKQLKERVESKNQIPIDIDKITDFQKTHIAGAINIPYDDVEFVKKVEKKFIDKEDDIILCCKPTVARQVGLLGKKLEKAGYKNVLGHTLGASDWKRSGLRTTPVRSRI